MIQRRAISMMIALLALTAVVPAARVHAAESTGQKKKGGGISFIQLPTLNATVLRGDGRRGVMTVEVGVDVANAGLRSKAQISQPRLQAAYAQMLEVYAAGLSPGAPPNADYISRMLQQQTDQVLGQPGARLLLGTILVN